MVRKWFILTTQFLCYTDYPFVKEIIQDPLQREVNQTESINRESVQLDTSQRMTALNTSKGKKKQDFQLKEVLLID